MDTNFFDDEKGNPTPESHGTKTWSSRLLPWIVLLLAALGLLYFLNRGCARAKTGFGERMGAAEKQTGSVLQTAKSSDAITRKVHDAEISATESDGSDRTEQSTRTVAMLKKALEEGTANPNDAYVLDHIGFEATSAILTRESITQLDQLVEICKKYPDCRLRIEGHTDNTGSSDNNVQLSSQRALAVKTYLQEKGIASHRLATSGRGQLKPLVPNDTEEGRARNNRIEFYVLV